MSVEPGLTAAVDMIMIGAIQAEARLFSNTLSVDECLPVEFQVVHSAMPQTTGFVARSERALTAMRLFDDGAADVADADCSDPMLKRIDAKINVLLDAMCDWMRVAQNTPAPCGLRLSRNGLRIDGRLEGFDIGVKGLVRIVLSRRFPQAIEIPAVGIAAEPLGNDGQRCWLQFDAPGESLVLALERYLFRTHRRIVAVNRHLA